MFPSVGYTLKREFSAYYRSLQHDKPQEFVTSQWQGKGGKNCICFYMVYKCTLAIYLVIMMSLDLIDLRSLGQPDRWVKIAKWPVHLTSWNTAALTLQSVLCALLVVRHHLNLAKPATNQMTNLHKAYWVVHNIANALSPAVTLLYWTAVYNSTHPVDLFNIHKHLLNSVFVVVDLLINSHPIRILHVYQPVLLGASYGGFTWIYYLCGGTSRELKNKIYTVLDWETPYIGLITTLCACALLVVLHTLLWVVHVARVRLARYIYAKEEQTPPQIIHM